MSEPIRVMTCDRCPTIRYGLHRILSSDAQIEIVAELHEPEEILSAANQVDADILIIDLDENNPSEIEYLRRFRNLQPGVKIIVFTACSDTGLVMETLDLGIQGFRLKHADSDEIIKTIHSVSRGGSSMASCVTHALLENMQKSHQRSQSQLSEREQEVLALVAEGMSNKGIADSLAISTRTVKFHVSAILAKLKVKNRTEAAIHLLL